MPAPVFGSQSSPAISETSRIQYGVPASVTMLPVPIEYRCLELWGQLRCYLVVWKHTILVKVPHFVHSPCSPRKVLPSRGVSRSHLGDQVAPDCGSKCARVSSCVVLLLSLGEVVSAAPSSSSPHASPPAPHNACGGCTPLPGWASQNVASVREQRALRSGLVMP